MISDALARQAPKGLLAIHLNMPATVPGDLMKAINSGYPAPASLSSPEREAYNPLSTFFGRNAAYGADNGDPAAHDWLFACRLAVWPGPGSTRNLPNGATVAAFPSAFFPRTKCLMTSRSTG